MNPFDQDHPDTLWKHVPFERGEALPFSWGCPVVQLTYLLSVPTELISSGVGILQAMISLN